MGRGYVRVFIVAICLNLACSSDPRSAPGAKSPAGKPSPQTPDYSAAGIAPSGATRPAPVAPGRIVSLFGRNLGPAGPCHASPDPNRRETPNPLRPNQTAIETQVLPTKLCDTEVRVGGVAAGLLYVSARQINFKVPQTAQTEGLLRPNQRRCDR